MSDASTLEVWWTGLNAVSFLLALWTGMVRLSKGYQAIRKGKNFATKLLFAQRAALVVLLLALTGVFTWMGWAAMNTPPPISRDVSANSVVLGYTFIGLAVLVMVFNLLMVVLDPMIDGHIRKLWMARHFKAAELKEKQAEDDVQEEDQDQDDQLYRGTGSGEVRAGGGAGDDHQARIAGIAAAILPEALTSLEINTQAVIANTEALEANTEIKEGETQ